MGTREISTNSQLPIHPPAFSTVAIGVFHRGGLQAGGPREEMRRWTAVMAAYSTAPLEPEEDSERWVRSIALSISFV